MGNILGSAAARYDSKGSNIRHKTGLVHIEGSPFPEIQDRSQEDATHKTYFVCKTYGKSDGWRMTTCVNRQVTLQEGQDWINRQVNAGGEAKGDAGRRTWESPYIYSLVQTNNAELLTELVGGRPVLVDF
jgi:hypothetical protein